MKKLLLLLLLLPSTAFAYVVKESKLNEPISFYVNDGTINTIKKGMEILATGVVNFPFGTTNALVDASPSVSGKVNTGVQSLGGVKTFTSTPVFSAMGTGTVKSSSGTLTAATIVNTDVDAAAAIATSKLSGAVTSITSNGLGALATLSSVASATITDNSIVNADVNSAAAIATSKLSGAVTSIASNGLGSLATLNSVASGTITDGSVTSTDIADDTIMNIDINTAAAIEGTKISPASATLPGVVTTGPQTLAGNKTFNGSVTLSTTGGNTPFSCTVRSSPGTSMSCNGGEIIVGGGCLCNNGGCSVTLRTSYPSSATGWACVWTGTDNPVTYGICCSI